MADREVDVDREDLNEQSIAELVQRASQQTAELVRQEIHLAQAELREKGRRAGVGAGMFGAAGLVALYGLGALVAAAIMGIGEALEPWAGALIVGAVLLAAAGLLALGGKEQVEQATPPVPEQAIESVQDDVQEIRERARR